MAADLNNCFVEINIALVAFLPSFLLHPLSAERGSNMGRADLCPGRYRSEQHSFSQLRLGTTSLTHQHAVALYFIIDTALDTACLLYPSRGHTRASGCGLLRERSLRVPGVRRQQQRFL